MNGTGVKEKEVLKKVGRCAAIIRGAGPSEAEAARDAACDTAQVAWDEEINEAIARAQHEANAAGKAASDAVIKEAIKNAKSEAKGSAPIDLEQILIEAVSAAAPDATAAATEAYDEVIYAAIAEATNAANAAAEKSFNADLAPRYVEELRRQGKPYTWEDCTRHCTQIATGPRK